MHAGWACVRWLLHGLRSLRACALSGVAGVAFSPLPAPSCPPSSPPEGTWVPVHPKCDGCCSMAQVSRNMHVRPPRPGGGLPDLL